MILFRSKIFIRLANPLMLYDIIFILKILQGLSLQGPQGLTLFSLNDFRGSLFYFNLNVGVVTFSKTQRSLFIKHP